MSIIDSLRTASGEVFSDTDVMRPDILTDDVGRVHDWRNYVPEVIEDIWDELDETQRRLVMLTGEVAAGREEWR
jgi:hypothetical protein